jgi:hypothetical protein
VWRAGNPADLQQCEDQADTGTAQDVAGLVHQVLATALLSEYHLGGTFLSGAGQRAQASSYMRGGEHRQVSQPTGSLVPI